ncbi:MAG: hypothetical protein P1P76_03025 [Anaerolineales bacterium]|nr:hypothetical protein [Anaerolineales bacterium]
MYTVFTYDHYTLKRQVLALTGKVRVFTPDGRLGLYSEQKMFRLREDIRVFEDESRTRELLWIQARQVIDFAAAYDVTDQTSGQKVGALRRKGWKSIVRDAWEVLDPMDQVIATIREESVGLAMLRRFLLGSLLPQRYEAVDMNETVLANYQQLFHLFRYQMNIHFSPGPIQLDRRLGLAASILLAIIEGKQSS